MFGNPLLCMVICLDETSPDAGYYLKTLQRFSSSMGCFLQLDGAPFRYPQLELLLDEIDRLGIEGVGIRTGDMLSEPNVALAAAHRIRSVMLRERAIEVRGIGCLKKVGVPIEISELITDRISEQLERMLPLCEEHGIRSIVLENSVIAKYRGIRVRELEPERRFMLMKDIVRHNQSSSAVGISLSHCPNKILLHPERSAGDPLGGCSAGIVSCATDIDGSIIPCLPLKDFRVGNIVYDDILSIWNDAPLFKQLKDRSRLMGTCGRCSYRNSCGGCRAVAYYDSGDIMASDVSCHLCVQN